MPEQPRPFRKKSALNLRARPASTPKRDSVPLLGAKLLPPKPGHFHYARTRLLDRLGRGLDSRATIVVAGPGYGKTSLLSRLFHEMADDSVWYWLDPTDRDPWIFFRYLVEGIKHHVPDFGERSERLWKDLRSRPFEVERLADIFISDVEESLVSRLVIVLDGVQHLEGNALCVRALKRLLAYLPGTLHLILAGRSLPDLGIKGLMAEGTVNLIEGDDLLFTLEETKALLIDTFGLAVQPETLNKVHARTRGWVTALQLLRQTARLGPTAPDLPEEVFARTDSEVFDYFGEEVFTAESEEVQDFLLGSCLPAFIDPEICAEVLGDSEVRSILASLLKRKLFLSPFESRREFYAYDPLFLDFLRRKLHSTHGDKGKRDLDLRYGRAFARRGAFSQALAHLMSAEDAGAVLELLARNGKSLLGAGTLDTVLRAARFLTDRGVQSAVVEDLLGEASRLAGDYTVAVRHFEKALAFEDAGGSPVLAGPARAGTLQGLAYALLKTGAAARAAELASQALAEAGDEDLSLVARILNILGIIRYRENRLEAALSCWQDGLTRARQAGDDHLTLMIAHNLGLPHAGRGDFRRATEYFQILTGPENPRNGPHEGAAYLNQARIATFQGEYERAATLLADAREIARRWHLPALTADVFEAEGSLLRETGDLDAAASKYAAARALFTELGQVDLLANLAEEEATLAARTHKHDEAERAAAGLVERARALKDSESLASALLALGEVRVRAGAHGGAATALSEAVPLFESLDRNYQRCLAHLWLALSLHHAGDKERATKESAAALHLAAEFGYEVPVLRVAGLDDGFRALLGSLPVAGIRLKELSARKPSEEPLPAEASIKTGVDLTIRLLGPIEVYGDSGRKIPPRAWKIRRALEVFCYIVSSRTHRAAKERIVDDLWGSAKLSVVEKNFHPTLSFLRRALNHGHNVTKSFVIYEKSAYLLNPTYRYEIDTETFESALQSAKRKASQRDLAGALADYTTAIRLYRGPFLEEDYSDWTEAPRAHFERLYQAALGEAGEIHMKVGDPEEGLSLLKKQVARDPLDEKASCRLMRASGSRGQRGAIEKEFSRLTQALQTELETEPLAETRRAYQEALDMGASREAGTGSEEKPSPGSVRRNPRLRTDR